VDGGGGRRVTLKDEARVYLNELEFRVKPKEKEMGWENEAFLPSPSFLNIIGV